MSLKQRVVQEFRKRFAAQPSYVVRAPGRVNLIGEHTDYSDGFVLPMAIDRAVWIALRPRNDGRVIGYSLDLRQTVDFSTRSDPDAGSGWGEYVKGVAWALAAAGFRLEGWEGVVTGDVPIGAGLSSSAALEMASIRAFAATSGFAWDAVRMAQIGQRAENEWVGIKCGIMDQLISAAGLAGHALLIDCRTLDIEPVPLPGDVAVAILDTTTRRGLVDSVYNQRRTQCETAARFFGVPALRDVTVGAFGAGAGRLDDTTRRRARHVVSENDRTLRSAAVMRRGDARELGALMNASHVSLRDDFEVSSDELNAIVGCAQSNEVCYGARMTGAGLGGCAVALVRANNVYAFAAEVAACYEETTNLKPNIYVCESTDGAEVEIIEETCVRRLR
jgi:galactokinase